MKFSRRSVLLGSVGVAGIGAAGALTVFELSDPVDYAKELLTQLAGPFEMDRADLEKMVHAAEPWFSNRKLRKLAFASPAQGILPTSWEEELDDFQRRLLLQLVVFSDYLAQKDVPGSKVTFMADKPCANPFARL